MKEIFIRSKYHAAMFESNIPFAAISVSTLLDDCPIISEINRIDLLKLNFTDRDWAESPTTETINKYDLFRPDQAEQIIDFVIRNWNKAETFLIHCEAGISRSPAIAAAITKITGCGDEKYYFNHYSPNKYVYRTILETYSAKNFQKFQKE